MPAIKYGQLTNPIPDGLEHLQSSFVYFPSEGCDEAEANRAFTRLVAILVLFFCSNSSSLSGDFSSMAFLRSE
jgi:hypothetical protein